jgi:glycine/D-amino acid oxidase-like deaminating enzyme
MTGPDGAEAVICGAGIAGVAAAYFLAARQGVKDVLLVDPNPPLSLTSDQSTECYRNWWPGPGEAMVGLMNRSIDLLEELADASNNVFLLNRRGYLYCTADRDKVPALIAEAHVISELGAGPLRLHTGLASGPPYRPAPAQGYLDQPEGADLLLDRELIQAHYPFLSSDICAALHARRAGWLSAQQLGMHLLQEARQFGVRLLNDRVVAVEMQGGRVRAIHLEGEGRVVTPAFVDAAGPYLKEVAEMQGVELPVFNELHLKVSFKDTEGALPRDAPLVIFLDTQTLHWTAEERQILAADPDYAWLLGALPAGAHTRPEGGAESSTILALWEYRSRPVEAVWPLPIDPEYPEMALRGLSRMIPGMGRYVGKFSRPQVDGGYYTKTRENRPLIGPLPVEGAYAIGALSGYGIMAACGAGDLLARCIAGDSLPSYAAAFTVERYQDPEYQKLLENWGESGQL